MTPLVAALTRARELVLADGSTMGILPALVKSTDEGASSRETAFTIYLAAERALRLSGAFPSIYRCDTAQARAVVLTEAIKWALKQPPEGRPHG